MTAPCACATLTPSLDDVNAWFDHDNAIHARGLVHANHRDWPLGGWVAANLPHELHRTCMFVDGRELVVPTLWVPEPLEMLYYRLRNAGLPLAANLAALARFAADPPAMQLAEAGSDAAIARLVRDLMGGVL